MDYKEFSEKFWKFAGEASSILITSHTDPDDDAIASVLSMYSIIKSRYPEKKTRIAFSSLVNQRWSYFENFEKIEFAGDIASIIDDFDMTLFLDANYAERFTRQPEKIAGYKGKKITMDHHGSKPMAFDLSLIEPDATSTSELIYLALLKDEAKLPAKLCETLLMGVMADTGGFQFMDHTNARIFEMAKRLVEDGQIDVNALRTKYSGFNLRVFQVLQELIGNTEVLEIPPWPKFVSAYVDEAFIGKGNFTSLEVDEAAGIFTSYLTSINEAAWGMVARPSGNRVKVSLRAKPGDLNVRKIAENMGKGSGHDLAAGLKFDGTSDVKGVLDEIKTWLKDHAVI